MALTDACRVGAQHLVALWGHPDQEEGPRAFVEKREASWQVTEATIAADRDITSDGPMTG